MQPRWFLVIALYQPFFSGAVFQFIDNASRVFIGNIIADPNATTGESCENSHFQAPSFTVTGKAIQLNDAQGSIGTLLLPHNAISLEVWVKFDKALLKSSSNFISASSGMFDFHLESQLGFRLGFQNNFPVFGVSLVTVDANGTKIHSQEPNAVSGPPLSMFKNETWYHFAGQ